jgi:hypothetical protein
MQTAIGPPERSWIRLNLSRQGSAQRMQAIVDRLH